MKKCVMLAVVGIFCATGLIRGDEHMVRVGLPVYKITNCQLDSLLAVFLDGMDEFTRHPESRFVRLNVWKDDVYEYGIGFSASDGKLDVVRDMDEIPDGVVARKGVNVFIYASQEGLATFFEKTNIKKWPDNILYISPDITNFVKAQTSTGYWWDMYYKNGIVKVASKDLQPELIFD